MDRDESSIESKGVHVEAHLQTPESEADSRKASHLSTSLTLQLGPDSFTFVERQWDRAKRASRRYASRSSCLETAKEEADSCTASHLSISPSTHPITTAPRQLLLGERQWELLNEQA